MTTYCGRCQQHHDGICDVPYQGTSSGKPWQPWTRPVPVEHLPVYGPHPWQACVWRPACHEWDRKPCRVAQYRGRLLMVKRVRWEFKHGHWATGWVWRVVPDADSWDEVLPTFARAASAAVRFVEAQR